MKKLLTLILTLALGLTACIGLTACKDNDANKPTILTGVELIKEEYGIAAKKGNDALISKINEALINLSTTQYLAVAAEYGLESSLCLDSSTENPLVTATDESWNSIKNAGKIVIGYTVFAPIAYEVENGTYIFKNVPLTDSPLLITIGDFIK
jgi:ABC-type amino acid transport substrate-binding protein